jgi:hypothetical protein
MACRMTNPIRRSEAASPRHEGEAWNNEPTERAEVTAKATLGHTTWLGAGRPEGRAG